MVSLGGYLHGLPAGFVMLLLASAIMGVGLAIADSLSGNLVIQFGMPVYQNITQLNLTPIKNITSTSDSLTLYDADGVKMVVITYDNNGSKVRYATYVNITGVYTAPVNGSESSNGTWRATLTPINGTWVKALSVSGTTNTFDAKIRYDTIDIVSADGESLEGWKPSTSYTWLYNTVYNVTITTTQVLVSQPHTLDLGFIPGLAVVFAGLYMFMKGLYQLTRTRI